MNKPAFLAVLILGTIPFAFSDETSFHRIHVADPKGRQIKAELTFSDQRKSVEVHPLKGQGISIPYSRIDKFSYEYTKRHRINEASVLTAPIGVGALAMLTRARSHWLEIDYFDAQSVRKAYVLRMDKNDYLRILEAAKIHTGKEPEVLGNADKRGR